MRQLLLTRYFIREGPKSHLLETPPSSKELLLQVEQIGREEGYSFCRGHELCDASAAADAKVAVDQAMVALRSPISEAVKGNDWLHKSFKPIGFRFEGALIFPERRVMSLVQDEIVFGVITQPAGEYAYPSGDRPEVVASTVARPLLTALLRAATPARRR